MRKARKIINILNGQKPKKKKRTPKKFFWPIPMFLFFLALVTASFILFKRGIWQFKMPPVSSPALATYEVSFTPLSDKRLSNSDLNTITQLVNSHMKVTQNKDFSFLAKKIQNQFTAQQVNISQTGTTKIAITMTLRDPVLLIKADKVRFVDKECSVYGEVHANDANYELPVLYDLFADQDIRLKLTETATYFISPEQQKLICDAIGLLHISREKGMDFSEVHFVKYRGFLAKTKTDGIEILLGYSPFNKRIDRLTEILLNLKKEGVSAARIEMDYDNKAFVKEKSSEIQRSL